MRSYDKEESGGIMEKGLSKEKTDEFVVVNDTATDMVCIRLVKRKVVVHCWPLLKTRSISFTSGFTNLSMAQRTNPFVSPENMNWVLF